jgi:hypothetical protein
MKSNHRNGQKKRLIVGKLYLPCRATAGRRSI